MGGSGRRGSWGGGGVVQGIGKWGHPQTLLMSRWGRCEKKKKKKKKKEKEKDAPRGGDSTGSGGWVGSGGGGWRIVSRDGTSKASGA